MCHHWSPWQLRAAPGFALGTLVLLSVACRSSASGAEPDLTRLPPVVNRKVDFDRDIHPILEETCLRCHGPEKPKSHFRLTDRESALKGGDENTDDIIPGDSAHSHLVQYIARIVEDMEMPPDGRGEPLTPAQVGLFRAWIDQGAKWSATNAGPQFSFDVAPTFRWIHVEGDKAKFREIEGVKDGFSGGVERFSINEQINPNEKFSAEGRALFPDEDYQLQLALKRTDLGFVRGGFEQWRRYYDDTGGYDPVVTPSGFNLNRDLHLDTGRAWIDFGLTLPHWPQIVLGYEYQFQRGEKSTLDWGLANGKSIYPATKSIDEQTQIIKLDVTRDVAGWHLADSGRVEFYSQNNQGGEAKVLGSGPVPDTFIQTRDDYHHTRGANSFSLEKALRDWWLLSGGYYYSRLEADAFFDQSTADVSGAPTSGKFWNSRITLSRESHVFSVASLFTPLEYLSITLGCQNEWSREDGFGETDLDGGDPNIPALFNLHAAPVQSALNEFKSMQNANVRFTKLPFTVLFADARLQQDSIGQFGSGQFWQETNSTVTPFARDTDYRNNRYVVRAGFNTSPWRWFEFNAQFRRSQSHSDYNHLHDSTVNSYPAFILAREIRTDQMDAKLVLHPATWVKLTLTYQVVATDYSTRTDPQFSPEILAGNYDAHVGGFGFTLTPFKRFYVSGMVTYSQSRVVTADNGNPSVVPYQGDTWSASGTASYVLSDATDLNLAWSLSHADYGQNNFADGLPLGLNFTRQTFTAGVTRKFSQRVSANLRYSFYDYSEPSSGGNNNYTAHGVFATVAVRWP